MKTQKEEVLEYLKNNKKITILEAKNGRKTSVAEYILN